MKKLLVLLFSAAGAFAQEPFYPGRATFTPRVPDSKTSVMLHFESEWRDSCVPHSPVVTKNGFEIIVRWSSGARSGFGCLTTLSSWSDDVSLGVLAPGVYNVDFQIANEQPVFQPGSATLVVTDGTGPYTISRSWASTRGGDVVFFERRTPADCTNATRMAVFLDGAPLQLVALDACGVSFRLPAHAAGPVDFVIHDNGATYTMRTSLEYLDPAAAPDPRYFERVLVPLLYNGAGQFGSQWTTEAEVLNVDYRTLEWFYDIAKPCAGCDRLEVRKSVSLTPLGNDTNGHILVLPRDGAKRVFVGALSRDVSRTAEHAGTEIPIAREDDFTPTDLALLNVPFGPQYRTTVRVYDLEGLSGTFGIAVVKNGTVIASKVYEMAGPCTRPPCNSTDPGFGSVDLATLVPRGASGPFTVMIYSSYGKRVWGFAAITNNTTQQVTTIRPQ